MFNYHELTTFSNAVTDNMCAAFEYLQNKPASGFNDRFVESIAAHLTSCFKNDPLVYSL